MFQSSSKDNNTTIYPNDINTELISRRNKLKKIREQGIAFPNDFRRNAITNQLHIQYAKTSKNELEQLNIQVILAGRLMKKRIMGKASFAVIQDMGGQIQLYISYNHLFRQNDYAQFKTWDLGDIIGIKGKLFRTNMGELSVLCKEIRLLTKSIRPLPEKFHGLSDKETCYRKRYLDLITNKESRSVFQNRSLIIKEIRQFLINLDFLEVETPMIQTLPGGATARPFRTYHNALHMDMYLRIAPELYLKQLVIGGFEKLFEINRNFRNEGISSYHYPEFTMIEIYMAYADYQDLMILLEDLIRTITKCVLGNYIIQYKDYTVNINQPFDKMTMKEAICRRFQSILNVENIDNFTILSSFAQSIDVKIEKNWGIGRIQTEIFESEIQKYLIKPTFITAYPVEVSPLARCNDHNPSVTDRFELFIYGCEISNGFSELNDPEEQAIRFHHQVINKKYECSDDIAFYDEDYIHALEYGLPPTAGLGIGIDRLVMLLTNRPSIRDVILFPTLRPPIRIKN
ncbi:lysine--tRNA ligase [Candidatus Schneideria nysicola]|uniref:lysine--tRNA ligase n=1 Tax=Candidatus Schneideria nysicola TaxID=1081631 RepID=UPI001CAA6DE6|nr:lysine--tRNA ligase [Candidatus Schneideria nysicola]UAJ65354.1 lysine--tRNA ligase [Candidatus Schneideria nysicola]